MQVCIVFSFYPLKSGKSSLRRRLSTILSSSWTLSVKYINLNALDFLPNTNYQNVLANKSLTRNPNPPKLTMRLPTILHRKDFSINPVKYSSQNYAIYNSYEVINYNRYDVIIFQQILFHGSIPSTFARGKYWMFQRRKRKTWNSNSQIAANSFDPSIERTIRWLFLNKLVRFHWQIKFSIKSFT